jgi:hypothetical protein
MNILSISWGANFADFDHDGDVDLFVSNGDLNPNCVPMANFYFENTGGTFREVAQDMGLADYGIGRGSVAFDLENDGDLDLLAVCQAPVLEGYPVDSRTRLFRNDLEGGNWLKVRLVGTGSERSGLGSRVTIYSQGEVMIREVDGGSSSHLSQHSRLLHFGLGGRERVDSILVTWNGGQQQLLLGQPVNQVLTVIQPLPSRMGFVLFYALAALLLGMIFTLMRYRSRRARA